jgi:hypothetical protein
MVVITQHKRIPYKNRVATKRILGSYIVYIKILLSLPGGSPTLLGRLAWRTPSSKFLTR